MERGALQVRVQPVGVERNRNRVERNEKKYRSDSLKVPVYNISQKEQQKKIPRPRQLSMYSSPTI